MGKRLYILSYNYPISFNTNNPSFGQQTIQSNGGKTLIFNSGESIHLNVDFFNGYLIDELTDVLALTIFSDINNQFGESIHTNGDFFNGYIVDEKLLPLIAGGINLAHQQLIQSYVDSPRYNPYI